MVKLKCRKCKSKNLVKAGTQIAKRAGGKQQRLKCNDCGHMFLVPMGSFDGPAKETSE